MNRQTDRQVDRQAGRQAGRQADRKADRQKEARRELLLGAHGWHDDKRSRRQPLDFPFEDST